MQIPLCQSNLSVRLLPVVGVIHHSHLLARWREEVPRTMLFAVVVYPMRDCNVVSFLRKCNSKSTYVPFPAHSLRWEPHLSPPLAYSSGEREAVFPNGDCDSRPNLHRAVSGIGVGFSADSRTYGEGGFDAKILSDLFPYRNQHFSLWIDGDNAEDVVAHCGGNFCRQFKSLCKYFNGTSNSSLLVSKGTSRCVSTNFAIPSLLTPANE